MAVKQWVDSVIAWVMSLRPVRVFLRYAEHRGPLLSAGLSYQAIFAVFAAIWVGFSIAGAVLRSNLELQEALFALLATSVPGLIDDGSGSGAIDPEQLLQAGILGWTGAIAAGVLLFTALGWLASGREAIRAMFGLGGQQVNPILAWLKDLGLALGFGAAILVSAALSVLSTSTLGVLLDWMGIDEQSAAAAIATRILGVLFVFVLDSVVLALFYRVVSGIAIPLRLLVPGTLIGALALGVLKILGTTLLGGASNNPLLASFAVIIGLLIWFNLVCQVILLGAAWIALDASDRGVDLSGSRALPGTKKQQPSGVGAAL